MITLYQFPPAWGIPNPSPFCMKVELYLRMADLPYRTVADINPSRAPKGKYPYIEDRGRKIADSGAIIDYLKAEHGDPLDAELGDVERATAHLVRRTLEESLYFFIVYSRWMDDVPWRDLRALFFGGLPPVLRDVVPIVARRSMRRALQAQGAGRHTPAEISAMARADLAAVSAVLGDRPFLLGDAPTSIDAVAYAFLANLIFAPLRTSLKADAESMPNLVAYCHRMKQRFDVNW